MASSLRQLKDEDLEYIHHMIRRDASTDLQIAKKAEKMLKKSLGKTNHAKEMIVGRYRKSAAYKKWLTLYQDREIRKGREVMKLRNNMEILTNLLKDNTSDKFESLSNHVQAKLLVLAVDADEDELKRAAGPKGWIGNTLKLNRFLLQDKWKKQVEALKAEIKKMSKKGKGKDVDYDAVVGAVDKLMGLK